MQHNLYDQITVWPVLSSVCRASMHKQVHYKLLVHFQWICTFPYVTKALPVWPDPPFCIEMHWGWPVRLDTATERSGLVHETTCTHWLWSFICKLDYLFYILFLFMTLFLSILLIYMYQQSWDCTLWHLTSTNVTLQGRDFTVYVYACWHDPKHSLSQCVARKCAHSWLLMSLNFFISG